MMFELLLYSTLVLHGIYINRFTLHKLLAIDFLLDFSCDIVFFNTHNFSGVSCSSVFGDWLSLAEIC